MVLNQMPANHNLAHVRRLKGMARIGMRVQIKTPLLAERRKGLPPKRLSCEASASCYGKQCRHRSATSELTYTTIQRLLQEGRMS